MSLVPDHPSPRSRLAPAVALLTVVVAVATAFAAARPRVESPHGKLKEECSTCHTASTWKIAKVKSSFDHSKYGFKIAGAHAATSCTACHGSLEFAAAPPQCVTCHKDPHRGEMGTECARCHGDRSFVDRGPMVHAHQLTRFPLTGSHAALDCESCHRPAAQGQMQFVGTRAQCQECHMAQYQSAKVPDHVAGHYPTECQSCHSTISWQGAKFDHNATGFPLTGAHRTTACESCHANGRFAGTPRDCASCHMTEYNAATPNHPSAGFAASACASCHNTTSWDAANFDHNSTAFPLTGAHTTTPCSSCHVGGVYAGTSKDCQGCHLTEYNAATPNHLSAGFAASACASCHNTTQWAGATFDHNATAFPLTGAHATTPCNSCHGDGVYQGKSTDCYSCHQGDYSGASPTHTAASFPPSQCASCHGTTSWATASFDHNSTAFPLTGAHTTTPCSSCHVGGVYAGTSRDCQGCHLTDYNNASPNHAAAGFAASACASCHNTTQWAGATFDHDSAWFPIYSGRHAGTWNACSDCHTNASNFTVFTCLSCHPHSDKAGTDSHHTQVNNYSYDSNACYSCHPRGRTG